MELKFNITPNMTQPYRDAVAKRIRVRIAELGLKNEQVKQLTGLTGKTILDLKQGTGNPSTENLYKMLRALEIDPETITF